MTISIMMSHTDNDQHEDNETLIPLQPLHGTTSNNSTKDAHQKPLDVHQCSSKAIQLYSVAEALDAASA
jgi:hypothetical protein